MPNEQIGERGADRNLTARAYIYTELLTVKAGPDRAPTSGSVASRTQRQGMEITQRALEQRGFEFEWSFFSLQSSASARHQKSVECSGKSSAFAIHVGNHFVIFSNLPVSTVDFELGQSGLNTRLTANPNFLPKVADGALPHARFGEWGHKTVFVQLRFVHMYHGGAGLPFLAVSSQIVHFTFNRSAYQARPRHQSQ